MIDEALNTVKRKVTNTPVLAYFDPEKELVLQVDSSKDGVRAAILQGGRPTEFASRTLTQAELKWAQTEKETLSLVFGLERFDQYTYGRKVHIQNDHKPLATILKKPLSQASRRIQSSSEWAEVKRKVLRDLNALQKCSVGCEQEGCSRQGILNRERLSMPVLNNSVIAMLNYSVMCRC